MKFFQKRSVAVVLTLLIILASIGLGQVRRPVQSSPAPEPADPSALDQPEHLRLHRLAVGRGRCALRCHRGDVVPL